MYHQYYQMKAMDTDIEIEGYRLTTDVEWKNEINDWFTNFETICSRFRLDSDLSILNKAKRNIVVQIDPILFQVLKKAMDYAIQTDFLFNPFVGSALKAYGYDKTFTDITNTNNWPTEQIEWDWKWQEPIVFLPMVHAIIKKIEYEIDLGGIAKGWSVDYVVSMMMERGLHSGIVNAGGDLFVWGENDRTIGISHPEPNRGDEDIIQFEMQNGGVATSNTLYRSWYMREQKVHHIFDGNRGISSKSDIVQATAFSMSTTEADVLAKILCMHSFHEAIPWLTKHFPHAGCIVVKDDGKIAIHPSVQNYITKLVM